MTGDINNNKMISIKISAAIDFLWPSKHARTARGNAQSENPARPIKGINTPVKIKASEIITVIIIRAMTFKKF